MRVALAIVIGILAVLIVLSEMGVNVTPLIAGASVFGLAISFGSQTLVPNMVSGHFLPHRRCIPDRRVYGLGEAKGTVEAFYLAIELRQRSGPHHSVRPTGADH